MAIPILKTWKNYFTTNRDEGLGSSYERIVLNLKLKKLVQKYQIKTALEVPIFGFTGLTGINSMDLARQGVEMTLMDNDAERMQWVQSVWEEIQLNAQFLVVDPFEKLPLLDNAVDFSWNFSAMWFVQDIDAFLQELTRITSKVIMICVPNRSGLGYLSQKYISGTDLRKYLNEDFIIPKNVIRSMKKLQWKLVDRNFIDCPPWPDIGMAKEDFLKIFGLGFLLSSQQEKPHQEVSIMNYYGQKEPDFPEKMLHYMWLEKMAPKCFKTFWAHHKFLIFEKMS